MPDIIEQKPTRISWWNQGSAEAQSAKKLAVVVGGVAAVAVLAPVITLAAMGIASLVALAIAGIAAIALVQVAPSISRYLTVKGHNFFLRQLKQEAAANPIETRQNNWRKEGEEIATAEQEYLAFCGEVAAFEGSLARSKQDFPDEDHTDQTSALSDMRQYAEVWKVRIEEAKVRHAKLGRKLQFAARKYEAALRAQSIQKKMDPDAREKMLREVMDETAIAAEDRAFGSAMASLRLAAQNKISRGMV